MGCRYLAFDGAEMGALRAGRYDLEQPIDLLGFRQHHSLKIQGERYWDPRSGLGVSARSCSGTRFP